MRPTVRALRRRGARPSSSGLAGAAAGIAACLVMLGACTAGTGGEAAAAFRDVAPDSRSWAPKPVARGHLKVVAEQAGAQLRLHTAHGDVWFWSGVNLGSTSPGHSPGELALSRSDYRRWFDLMGRMGIRTLRVYTIHPPAMYEEFLRNNLDHPDAPLYLVQGIYLPVETYLQTHDLFDAAATREMTRELRDASAAVHGSLTRAGLRGRANGTWTADVSAWTAAWIAGVEWDPVATQASDIANATVPGHRGRYFSSAPNASPTERWIAARMDELATSEAARGVSVPIAHANWPTTDPLRHPTEPLPQEDLVGVDANHVTASEAWPGGTFASYHAYPYYPDFLRHQPDYQRSGDAYQAYLQDLQRHHAGMPVMVTEFGVPSSLGSAHAGTNGRDQGHHSEQQAMAIDGDMLRRFKDIGLAGGLLFAWTDEWFKFTWNTLPRQAPVHPERRSLWHDPLTNEQHLGLLAQDPRRVGRAVRYESRQGVRQVAVDLDASYIYLTVTFDEAPEATIRVGFDVVPGGSALPGLEQQDSGTSDYAVVVSPTKETATAYVRSAIDPVLLDGLPNGSLPTADPPGWSLQRLTTNRPFMVPVLGTLTPPEFLDVGTLHRGSWDAGRPGYSSLSTWQLHDRVLQLRLPWSMLGFADPSSRVAVVPDHGVARGVPASRVMVTLDAGSAGAASFPVTWDSWNQARYTERVKAGAQAFVDALTATAR